VVVSTVQRFRRVNVVCPQRPDEEPEKLIDMSTRHKEKVDNSYVVMATALQFSVLVKIFIIHLHQYESSFTIGSRK